MRYDLAIVVLLEQVLSHVSHRFLVLRNLLLNIFNVDILRVGSLLAYLYHGLAIYV